MDSILWILYYGFYSMDSILWILYQKFYFRTSTYVGAYKKVLLIQNQYFQNKMKSLVNKVDLKIRSKKRYSNDLQTKNDSE